MVQITPAAVVVGDAMISASLDVDGSEVGALVNSKHDKQQSASHLLTPH